MTARGSWQRAYEVLDELLDLDAEARRARLAELDLDAGDRQRVESLLRADEAGGGVLDRPVETAIDGLTSAGSGRIGPWRLGPEIGRGGMSVVYRATRDDAGFEQTAALKLLHATRLDAASIERFQREQQILADLHHPNLATLLDGGVTSDGTPFLVMEEIRGRRLDEYCGARSLGARAVVELLLPVCDAVAFAHRSLVVHRDLKPANVLVGDDGRPRLLDFGVAKLLAAEGTGADSGHTTTRVLTPGFGAPEQAAGGAVTTATDVYGLGAVLYRLLTGSTPYPADAFLGDRQDAPAPVAPSRTAKRVAGIDADLDNVILKALRVEPERRYAGVEALSQDLRNWLAGLPVSATPDRLGYRLRKLATRHRTAVLAAAVALLGLLIGSGVALWQASVARAESYRAQSAAADAESQAERAEAVTDFLVQTISAADPEATLGADATVRQVIDSGIERIGKELADEPETRARLRSVLAKILYRLGEFEKAAGIFAENLASEGLTTEIRLHDLTVLANCARVLGRSEDAERRFLQAIDLAREVNPVELAIAETSYASFLVATGRIEEALARIDSASAQTWLESAPADELADLEETVARALIEMARYDEAEAHAEWALDLRLSGGEPLRTAVALSLGQLSNIRADLGDLEGAAELKRRALAMQMELLGPEHVNTQISRNDLATLLKNLGRFDESAELLESVLEQQVEMLGPEHRFVADAHFALGQALFLAGRRDEALVHYRRAAEISDMAPTAAGPFHGVHHAIYGHALVLTHPDDPDSVSRGEAEIEQGIQLVAGLMGSDHPLTARVRTLYAEVLNDLDRHEEAREQMEEALPILDASYGPDSRHAALARIERGRALASGPASEPSDEAESALRVALAAFEDSSYRHQYRRQIDKANSLLRSLQAPERAPDRAADPAREPSPTTR